MCCRDVIAGFAGESEINIGKDSLVALEIRFVVGFFRKTEDAPQEHPLLFRRGRQRARCIRTLSVGSRKFFVYSFLLGKFRHRASIETRA